MGVAGLAARGCLLVKFEHHIHWHDAEHKEIKRALGRIMALLDDLTAKVSALTTVVGSATTLLDGIKAQLDAALALGDPAAIIAGVQSLANELGADTQALADAVARNTPA